MYQPGELRVDGKVRYDGKSDADLTGVNAYLPHSCEEWVIGGPEQIKAMIADLQAALATFDTRAGGN